MKRFVFFVTTILIIAAVFFISCEEQKVEFDSEYISDVAMTASVDRAFKPLNKTNTFNTDTPRIYCTFRVINAPAGTVVTAEWIYKGTTGVEDQFIDSWTEFVEGNKNMAMFMNLPARGRPIGEYEIILSIDGKPQGSIPFEVK
jgi:hypothetical protein